MVTDPTALFSVAPNASNETLITNSYETFACVSTLLLDLSKDLSGKHRDIALAIHPLSELDKGRQTHLTIPTKGENTARLGVGPARSCGQWISSSPSLGLQP